MFHGQQLVLEPVTQKKATGGKHIRMGSFRANQILTKMEHHTNSDIFVNASLHNNSSGTSNPLNDAIKVQ